MGIFVPYYISQLRDVTLASLANDDFLQRKGGAWVNRTIAQVKADLALSGTNSGDQTITLTGDVTGSGTGSFAATIANNAVTLAKMATVATATFLGRTSASTGNVEALTATQATALLNAFVGDSGSGGTKGLVPAPTTGDSSKFLKGDGSWATPTAGAAGDPTASLGLTAVNGVASTYMRSDAAPALDVSIAPTWTGLHTFTQSTNATTAAYSISLHTSATATSGNQKWSPFIRQRGSGWGTTGGAAQTVDYIYGVKPTQGTTPTGPWVLMSSVNGAAAANCIQVNLSGTSSTTSTTGTLVVTGGVGISENLTVGGNNLDHYGGTANILFRVNASGQAKLTSTGTLGWAGTNTAGATPDTYLGRGGAAANMRQGDADANPPVSQRFSVQNATGTNVNGANRYISGSQSRGTGVGGDIIFDCSPPGSSGSTQNSLTTNFTIKGDAAKSSNFSGPVGFTAYTVAGLPAAASYQYHRAFVTDASAPTFGSTVSGGGAVKTPVWSDGTNWIVG